MGIGSSCYPIRRDRNGLSFDSQEPYDAKRLLSELITVQTAIILTEGVADDMSPADSKTPGRRQSIEYTITTSLSLPGLTKHNRDNRPGDRKLHFPGSTVVDIMNAHFKSDMTMPCIQEISEVSICS